MHKTTDSERERDATIPRTQNPAWGFYGTCRTNGHADVDGAWAEAIGILTDPEGCFRLEPEVARDLLDAPWGRHPCERGGRFRSHGRRRGPRGGPAMDEEHAQDHPGDHPRPGGRRTLNQPNVGHGPARRRQDHEDQDHHQEEGDKGP